MFDTPVDTLYRWVGAAMASLAVAGVVTGLPTHPAPDATGVASTVDAVAASPYPSTAEHPLAADRVKLGPGRLTLDGPGGTAHATFAYGPVTPVGSGSGLARVLSGVPPERVFDRPADLASAASDARERDARWRAANGVVRVRTVVWEGVRVTLVGV